jgi:hypothetical protein
MQAKTQSSIQTRNHAQTDPTHSLLTLDSKQIPFHRQRPIFPYAHSKKQTLKNIHPHTLTHSYSLASHSTLSSSLIPFHTHHGKVESIFARSIWILYRSENQRNGRGASCRFAFATQTHTHKNTHTHIDKHTYHTTTNMQEQCTECGWRARTVEGTHTHSHKYCKHTRTHANRDTCSHTQE